MSWFEEPVTSDDLEGLRVRDKPPQEWILPPESTGTTWCISNACSTHKPAACRRSSQIKYHLRNAWCGVRGRGWRRPLYLAMHLFGGRLSEMLGEIVPDAKLTPADAWLRKLSAVKTHRELERIRQGCAIAKNAFELGAAQLKAGLSEQEAAQFFRAPLSITNVAGPAIHRHDGFAFCMSGPNAAKASAAYARTRRRALEENDLVMIHCNSYVDGFWTDITRTYTFRIPSERQVKMYEAVFAARAAALSSIKPRAPAAEVDRAARQVIENFSFGNYLKHGTGHGVGFSPMSAYSVPQIHAESPDILEAGMVFNVEPAIYIEGYGGLRQCDMVTVTGDGFELLTQFGIPAPRV